jgi:hypothetical protein
MTNGLGDDARTVLTEVLLKHFTAPGNARDVASYADELARDDAAPSHSRAPDVSARVPATKAGLQPWLGVWRDPWFGEVSICVRGDAVRFDAAKSPSMRGQVMQLGERWLVDWDEDSVDAEAWLTFAGSGDGATLAMSKVDPDADFSFDYEDLAFRRIRACE